MAIRARVMGVEVDTERTEARTEREMDLPVERARLVRLCAHFTGDVHAAEDLAQETLLLAWRQERELRDPAKRSQWLSGIARNLCFHWLRRRGLEASRFVQPDSRGERGVGDLHELATDPFDLEVELERRELVDLLDRAMVLLPPETRDVLVRRYVHESPHAEIAEWLQVSEQAVAMRLNRGKLLLKRALATDLRQEAVAYGLAVPDSDGWQETRIWCPGCGRRKLLGRFAEDRELQLDCVGCDCMGAMGVPRSVVVRAGVTEVLRGIKPAELFEGVKGYKPALNRLLVEMHAFFRHGIMGRTARCHWCHGEAPLYTSPEEAFGWHYVQTDCSHCGRVNGIGTVIWRVLELPEGRAFWREHPRIRALPEREVEAAGVPAIVSSYESVTESARLEVIFVRDTLEVIGVHGVSKE